MMATRTHEAPADGRPLVRAGERAVLLSHSDYRRARAEGRGVEDYDILMRRPDDDEPEGAGASEDERWITVPASKYLKHRAIGWREAESIDDLPEAWRESAGGRDLFSAGSPPAEGEE